MIENSIGVIKKYFVVIIVALAIILLGVTALLGYNIFSNRNNIKNIKTNAYELSYNSMWHLKKKTADNIVLKHSSKSVVNIQISSLDNNYEYMSIDDLIDEILYNVSSQNSAYKLLKMENAKLTKFNFNGYKILYESDDKQVLFYTYKKSNKLVTISYEANLEYFDILLDSVNNIVYSLNVKDENFSLNNKLNIKTDQIVFGKNSKFDEQLNGSTKYELASDNYYVSYDLPNNFIQSDISSIFGQYKFNGDYDITINTKIYAKNIYQYLEKDSYGTIYSAFSSYKDNDDYSDFKEILQKINGEYEGYIYKCSYKYDKAIKFEGYEKIEYQRLDENIIMVYSLDKTHILTITISAKDVPITKKFIDMIKINEVKNYASYITSTKENGYVTSSLKAYTDYNKDKIYNIMISLPDKYEEIDKNMNTYENKYYGLNYNEDKEIYDYEIRYELTSTTDINSVIERYNNLPTVYGEYKNYTFTSNLTLNNKEFAIYDGGYTQLGGIMFTDINRQKYYVQKKALIYKLESGYLIVDISANGKDIDDTLLNEVSNFTVQIEKI